MTNGEQIDACVDSRNEPPRAEPKAPAADKYDLDFAQGYNVPRHGAMPNNQYWYDRRSVTPREAAILFCGGNPNPGRNGYEPSCTEELECVLVAHNERDPARRTWREWYQVIKEIGVLLPADERDFDSFFASMEPPAIEEAAQPQAAVPTLTETQEQRQSERWQLCIDSGLTMPTDTYARLPRGVGKVAVQLGITRQALAQDLKAHRERIFSK